MLKLENSAQIFNALSDLPGGIDEVDKLIEVSLIYVLCYLILMFWISLSELRNKKHLTLSSTMVNFC